MHTCLLAQCYTESYLCRDSQNRLLEDDDMLSFSLSFACCLSVFYSIHFSFEYSPKEIDHLDATTRQAYEVANEFFPDLVQRETPIIDFLRTEDWNVTLAARRLAMYWKYRKELFQSRWLLPMNQTGTGALNAQDVAMLRTGYCAIFARPTEGCLIVYNHARLPYFDLETHMRIGMYICTCFTDPVSQTLSGGCVYVVHSHSSNSNSEGMASIPPVNTSPRGWEMFRVAMPMKAPRQFIVAQAYEPHKADLLQFLSYKEARTAQFRARQLPHILQASSSRGTLALLEARGIERQYVPVSLGGDYRYNEFDEWIRTRISIEDLLSSAPLTISRRPLCLSDIGNDSSAQQNVVLRNDNEQQPQHRSKGALYSKRSYDRRKAEHAQLKEEVKSALERNHALKAENVRLQALLEQADACLKQHDE